MKQLFNFLTLILFAFFFSCNQKEQQKEDYSTKIDSLIQTTSPRSFNGVILITQNGKTKYSKAYGYSNFEDKTPISIKDNFRIQSNSKQVSAVLILKEVENGKIDLSSPIRKYLPDLRQTWADTVTVHQLLNMSSGIIALEKCLIAIAMKLANLITDLSMDIGFQMTSSTFWILIVLDLLKKHGQTSFLPGELSQICMT